MAMKKISEYERFMALSDAERDAEVSVYERSPSGIADGKPLRASDRALHRKARARGAAVAAGKAAPAERVAAAGPGRPRVGKGAKIVPVSIERGLLKQADAFAREHGLKRSQMVAQGLRLVMQHV
jgi:hypothetical protein